jgi:hypothetical protein
MYAHGNSQLIHHWLKKTIQPILRSDPFVNEKKTYLIYVLYWENSINYSFKVHIPYKVNG